MNIARILGGWVLSVLVSPLAAQDLHLYKLPAAGDALVGRAQAVSAQAEDTLVAVARRHGVGYNAIRSANPALDAWLPGAAAPVVLPTRALLPVAEHRGIVVNLPEMRLYYFPPGDTRRVAVLPVSVGRGDWNTPLSTTRVTRKATDPSWFPPESIREEHAARGDPLPKRVPGGPDNPLGRHALYLDLPGYLIHGTNKRFGIGMQVTHGCLRLYPDHIAWLHQQVALGTPVQMVHQRLKLGWSDGVLYLEVHPPLEGEFASLGVDLEALNVRIREALREHPDYPVDRARARAVLMEASGVPEPIGPSLRSDDGVEIACGYGRRCNAGNERTGSAEALR